MNTISYCLFGDDPMYHIGAIRNAEDAKWAYPGWEVRINTTFPDDSPTVVKLKELGATIIKTEQSKHGRRTQQLDRLNVIMDEDEGYYMLRDTDARFTNREIAAVHQWMYSGTPFHVMRDHPSHHRLMMGGMWGGRKGQLKHIQRDLDKWRETGKSDELGTDQEFLSTCIWSHIEDRCIQHDSCLRNTHPNSIPFPSGISDFRFIGEQIDEHDRPKYPESWKLRYQFIRGAFGIYS